MLKDKFNMVGHLQIKCRKKDGSEKTYNFDNLVVNNGRALVASRLTGNTPAAVSHMALGASATPPAVGQTGLLDELGRVVLDSRGATAAVATFVGSFPPGTATGSIAEAGLFNDASAGTMFSRATFSPIPKGAEDAIDITWTVVVS